MVDTQNFPATDGGVAALERAFTVLRALETSDAPVTLAELSRATGLYKSTILRLMTSLERNGYAVKLHDGCYDLGVIAFRFGIAYERKNRLRASVVPVLRSLVAQGTESASFHVRQDATHRLCLLREDSRHATLDRVTAGDVFSLKAGAAGHVLLAFEGETGKRYDDIRTCGWTLSLGERDPACAGVAAPVFGPAGILGALSLSGPRERFGESAIKKMRSTLATGARELTTQLGGTWPTFRRTVQE
ncbi:MAG: IclR family transcriptional regulator [Bradyrhizobiaceae bacterium PARB1]|jgi:DNA-binding IclR family transcriptional regulator|nr:MAG: IclR family transcriptional regulator [Bradyrhizobiaceae bacterium PARB1]